MGFVTRMARQRFIGERWSFSMEDTRVREALVAVKPSEVSSAMSSEFVHREILGKRVHRYGISASYGLDEAGVREAIDLGASYLFWSPVKKYLKTIIKDTVMKDRERFMLATGPILGYFGGSVRRTVEKRLRESGSDYLDIVQVFWAGRMSFLSKSVVGELVKLREEGKARAIGVSIHDRKRAAKLAAEGPLDFFMIRYNAAHPGAEIDIFPHLPQLPAKKPIIAAYTATSWGKLLLPPKGWEGPAATAGDCFRFCLTNPNVDLVVSAPKTTAQMRENMKALERGPLSDDEMARMRALGKAVHG
jgi:diketogulonate reductase-like aldo/keto reductase